jgi:enamine deaminase RidA (YjgF/YER057c/UK114 family)
LNMKREDILKELGISLPKCSGISQEVAAYKVAGKLIYTSGLVPRNPDGTFVAGKLGREYTSAQGQAFVKDVAVQLLSALQDAAGGLDNIRQIVMLQCFVNADPGYSEHSLLFNPASELFTSVFGEDGRHARYALGMSSLPMNVPVEISVIAEMN